MYAANPDMANAGFPWTDDVQVTGAADSYLTPIIWLDLSAIPAPARPALAEALQAAVARLAEGGTSLDPTGAGDALLRELIRRQMAGMLREAGAERCLACNGQKWTRQGPYAYRCSRCGGMGREPQAGEGGR